MAEAHDAPSPPARPGGMPAGPDRGPNELLAEKLGAIKADIEHLTEKLHPVADAAERIGRREDAEARLLQHLGQIRQTSANADATLTRIYRGLRNYRWIVGALLVVWTAAFSVAGMVAESEFGWAAGFRPEYAFRHQAWAKHGEDIRRCYARAEQENARQWCRYFADPQTKRTER